MITYPAAGRGSRRWPPSSAWSRPRPVLPGSLVTWWCWSCQWLPGSSSGYPPPGTGPVGSSTHADDSASLHALSYRNIQIGRNRGENLRAERFWGWVVVTDPRGVSKLPLPLSLTFKQRKIFILILIHVNVVNSKTCMTKLRDFPPPPPKKFRI